MTSADGGPERLPKLSEHEKDLLRRHQGCSKCRRFYAGHRADQCKNNYPSPDSYEGSPLTEEAAFGARAESHSNKAKSKDKIVPAGISKIRAPRPPEPFRPRTHNQPSQSISVRPKPLITPRPAKAAPDETKQGDPLSDFVTSRKKQLTAKTGGFFIDYLLERNHLKTLPLSDLSNSRLGIDASYYLQLLTANPQSREPLLAATGGLPLVLTKRIESDLRALEKLGIKPIFVFPGLLPNKRWLQQDYAEHFEARRDRREAWAMYEHGREEDVTKLFKGDAQWALWRMVLRIFRNRNVEFLIAPYVAWAQLIYLQCHHNSYIDAIFGPTDTLLYPEVDRLITALDLNSPNPTFQYTSRRAFLPDLGVTEDQFLDIGILCGSHYSPPFPPTVHEQIQAIINMVKYYGSGYAAVSAFSDLPTVKTIQYPDHYARTRSMIKYSLIFSSEGTVLPLPLALTTPAGHGYPNDRPHLTAADIPQDLHEIFTHRLPDEIYYYLSRGLLGPQALVWLTTGCIVEEPPLDSVETTEYKSFVKEVITYGQTGLRATVLALVCSVTHSFWTSKKVQAFFWFDQHNPKAVQHNSSQMAQLTERVTSWNVTYSTITKERTRQNSSTIDFAFCLGATSSERLAISTKLKNKSNAPLKRKEEVVANVIWRFLELRDFLLNSHTHSPLGRAMYSAIKLERVDDKFQEPLYLFLELVRAGVMHGHLWSGCAFSGGPRFGVDDEKSSMLLVMRVLSIVPLNFKVQPWSGPLSRELLVFNSFVLTLSRALRTLLEVISLNMLLRNDARPARDDLLDIALSLPFREEVNTGLGVLAKVYLDGLIHFNRETRVQDPNAPGVKVAKEMALDLCEKTFPGVKHPKVEVERGFRFWDVALAAMRRLLSEGSVLRELIQQFEAAEAWLSPMRP